MLDLIGVLLDDMDFQAELCGRCWCLDRRGECLIGRDIEDPKCERHGLYLAICAILGEAMTEIKQEMADWGCEK